jgi:hypothetical protein
MTLRLYIDAIIAAIPQQGLTEADLAPDPDDDEEENIDIP